MSARYDVIIIGAGPAGSATAFFLARAGLNVLLLDKFDFPRDKTCGDGLPPRAVAAVHALGLAEQLSRGAACATEFQIASPGGRALVVGVPPGGELPRYTMVMPRYQLDQLLRERALSQGAHFQSPIDVRSVEATQGAVVVRGERNRQPVRLTGRIAVLACGANLALARRLGLLPRPPALLIAARAYYEQLRALDGRVHFRFDCLPLPSYGWLFPLSDSSANIGAGLLHGAVRGGGAPATAREAFSRFTRSEPLRELLAGAVQIGATKSHPIRIDFPTARTSCPGLLAVGEAAGLVNPLTGDGIDYALETGRLAADHLQHMLASGDFSDERLGEYDRMLRERYLPLFRWSERLRWLLSHPRLFDRLAVAVDGDPLLQQLLVAVVLRARQPNARTLARLLLRALAA